MLYKEDETLRYLFQVWQEVLRRPALGLPGVEIAALAPRVHHGVNRGAAAERVAGRLRRLAVPELLLLLGHEPGYSVSWGVVPRPQDRVDHVGHILAVPAALDNQDGQIGVRIRQSRRYYATGGTAWCWWLAKRGYELCSL